MCSKIRKIATMIAWFVAAGLGASRLAVPVRTSLTKGVFEKEEIPKVL